MVLFIPVAGINLCAAQEMRVWTNDQGYQVTAALIAARETEIDLQPKDGQGTVTVKRHVLSGEDENYVARWILEKGIDAAGEHPAGKKQDMPDINDIIIPDEVIWNKPWPRVARPEAVTVKTEREEDADNRYHSSHFLLSCYTPLLKEEQEALVNELETCLAALAALPLNLQLAANPQRKYKVQVYFDESWYVKAGGVKGQPFTSANTSSLVKLKRTPTGAATGLRQLNAMHELTHWVTQFAGQDFWFNEGLAMYMELLERKDGAVLFARDLDRVAQAVPRIYRRGWESMPSLESIIGNNGKDKSPRMKAASLMAAAYFLRLDGKGDGARIKQYVKAIQNGETNIETLNALLLDGRAWNEVETGIMGAWGKRLTPVFERGK